MKKGFDFKKKSNPHSFTPYRGLCQISTSGWFKICPDFWEFDTFSLFIATFDHSLDHFKPAVGFDIT